MQHLRLTGIILAPLSVYVLLVAQNGYAEVHCPESKHLDAFSAEEATTEIVSVNRHTDEGIDEYIFHIDLNYGDLTLMAVSLMYVSDDQLMLTATVKTYPLSETQVFGSILVDPTISDDVQLVWTYFESGKLCPEYKHFRYEISET